MALALPLDLSPSVVSDKTGSALMGWIGERVLYARFFGAISPELGRTHALRFDAMTARSVNVAYFADGSGLTRYDLLVRSAFARFALARPRLFASITLLVPNPGVRRAAGPLTDALPGIFRLTSDPDDFETELLAAAPFAFTTPIFKSNGVRGQIPLRSSLRPKHPYRNA